MTKFSFRRFLEDANSSQTIDYVPQQQDAGATQANAGDQTTLDYNVNQVTQKLAVLSKAVQAIDPSVGGNGFSGTPDYTSPEQAAGKGAAEPDMLSDLSATMSRTSPQVSQMLRGLIAPFKQFRTALDAALSSAPAQRENVELARRLDVMSVRSLNQRVAAIGQAIQQFTPQEQRAVAGFQQVRQTWTAFFTQFQKAYPQMDRALSQAHQQVANQAWDYTKQWQGPFTNQ